MDKRRIRFKVFVYFIAAAVAGTVLFAPFSSAGSSDVDDLKDQLQDLNDQKGNLNSDLKDGRARAAQLASEIKALENRIYTTQGEINSLQRNINETKTRISEALAQLELLQSDLDKQNEDLNARLRSMYKSGEVGMLSVLLGSSSMSEFMTNMDMVERIYDADAELLASIQSRYDAVDEHKAKLQGLKDQLLAQQKTAEEKKAALESDRSAVSSKKKEVDSDNALLEAQIDAINKEASALSAKILSLQSSKAYIGGSMCWPSQASTRVTSPFGIRNHPILKRPKMHTGIDIGAAGGTNILAANGGTVIIAGWNNSYGYMVMIDHGGGIVTLYAHSSKLLVKKGDVVGRGQAIALIGSTGMSTGNHLHFEVRVNGVYQDPLNYVSPSVRN